MSPESVRLLLFLLCSHESVRLLLFLLLMCSFHEWQSIPAEDWANAMSWGRKLEGRGMSDVCVITGDGGVVGREAEAGGLQSWGETGLCCVEELDLEEGVDEVEAVQSIFLLPSGVACGFPGSRVCFLVFCNLLPCQPVVDRQ